MKNNIMSIVGKMVFVLLCAKYRHDQDEYLSIMKLDRLQIVSGFNPCEYGEIIKALPDEQGWLNNFGNVLPSQFLTQQSFTNVGVEK